jgi:hypothetical protein
VVPACDVGGDDFVETAGGLVEPGLGDEAETRAVGEAEEGGLLVEREEREQDIPRLFIRARLGRELAELIRRDLERAEEVGNA